MNYAWIQPLRAQMTQREHEYHESENWGKFCASDGTRNPHNPQKPKHAMFSRPGVMKYHSHPNECAHSRSVLWYNDPKRGLHFPQDPLCLTMGSTRTTYLQLYGRRPSPVRRPSDISACAGRFRMAPAPSNSKGSEAFTKHFSESFCQMCKTLGPFGNAENWFGLWLLCASR